MNKIKEETKMKLVKALKMKNRIAGEVNRLRQIFSRENCKENVDQKKHSECVSEIENQMKEAMDKLISVKSAIAIANVGVYSKICRMEELKGLKTFYSELETKHGEFKVSNYNGESTTVFSSYIKQKDADTIDKELQLQINKLQDEIDEYNASTEADISE